MKLLFCADCSDIFKLMTFELRQCACGEVKGKYNADGHTAVVNGKGYSLAIGNGSLWKALFGDITQFEYEDYVTFLAWTRPHTGEKNPRTTIDETL